MTHLQAGHGVMGVSLIVLGRPCDTLALTVRPHRAVHSAPCALLCHPPPATTNCRSLPASSLLPARTACEAPARQVPTILLLLLFYYCSYFLQPPQATAREVTAQFASGAAPPPEGRPQRSVTAASLAVRHSDLCDRP